MLDSANRGLLCDPPFDNVRSCLKLVPRCSAARFTLERRYVYDSELAPTDHFREVIDHARIPEPSEASQLVTGEYANGSWIKYPHSRLPSSHLDTPEINPHPALHPSDWGENAETDDAAITFRHSGWLRQRRLVRTALLDTGVKPRPLARFDRCGSDPWVVVDESDPQHLAIHSNHCHSRWCTPCSRERAHRIIGNLHPTLERGDVRFLTLTLKHSRTPLSSQIDRIYDSFRKLRRAAFWKDAVDGGCAILETVHSQTTKLWHVHLHCLIHGTWIDDEAVKAEWWRITGDSFIVDIRECANADHAAHYVTKYITKPVPNSVINKPAQLCEMISAYAGRRLVLTWGAWRGVRLSVPLDETAWKSIAPLPVLYQRRDAGNAEAYLILTRLEALLPEAPIIAGRDPPTPLDDPIGHLF